MWVDCCCCQCWIKLLGDGTENADKIIVGGIESDVGGYLNEESVEALPKLRYGELAWMLWVG